MEQEEFDDGGRQKKIKFGRRSNQWVFVEKIALEKKADDREVDSLLISNQAHSPRQPNSSVQSPDRETLAKESSRDNVNEIVAPNSERDPIVGSVLGNERPTQRTDVASDIDTGILPPDTKPSGQILPELHTDAINALSEDSSNLMFVPETKVLNTEMSQPPFTSFSKPQVIDNNEDVSVQKIFLPNDSKVADSDVDALNSQQHISTLQSSSSTKDGNVPARGPIIGLDSPVIEGVSQEKTTHSIYPVKDASDWSLSGTSSSAEDEEGIAEQESEEEEPQEYEGIEESMSHQSDSQNGDDLDDASSVDYPSWSRNQHPMFSSEFSDSHSVSSEPLEEPSEINEMSEELSEIEELLEASSEKSIHSESSSERHSSVQFSPESEVIAEPIVTSSSPSKSDGSGHHELGIVAESPSDQSNPVSLTGSQRSPLLDSAVDQSTSPKINPDRPLILHEKATLQDISVIQTTLDSPIPKAQEHLLKAQQATTDSVLKDSEISDIVKTPYLATSAENVVAKNVAIESELAEMEDVRSENFEVEEDQAVQYPRIEVVQKETKDAVDSEIVDKTSSINKSELMLTSAQPTGLQTDPNQCLSDSDKPPTISEHLIEERVTGTELSRHILVYEFNSKTQPAVPENGVKNLAISKSDLEARNADLHIVHHDEPDVKPAFDRDTESEPQPALISAKPQTEVIDLEDEEEEGEEEEKEEEAKVEADITVEGKEKVDDEEVDEVDGDQEKPGRPSEAVQASVELASAVLRPSSTMSTNGKDLNDQAQDSCENESASLTGARSEIVTDEIDEMLFNQQQSFSALIPVENQPQRDTLENRADEASSTTSDLPPLEDLFAAKQPIQASQIQDSHAPEGITQNQPLHEFIAEDKLVDDSMIDPSLRTQLLTPQATQGAQILSEASLPSSQSFSNDDPELLTPKLTQSTEPNPPASVVETPQQRHFFIEKVKAMKSLSADAVRTGTTPSIPNAISPWFASKKYSQKTHISDSEGEGGFGGFEDHSEDEVCALEAHPQHLDHQNLTISPHLHDLAKKPFPPPVSTIKTTTPVNGFRTSFSYFTPLSALQSHYNNLVDILAISISRSNITLSTAGPKDKCVILRLTDPSSLSNFSLSSVPYTVAQLFRPQRNALPSTNRGDAILLRNFKVQSSEQKLTLLSTESSAWAVFRKASEVQINGPPVEFGAEERGFARGLSDWWNVAGDRVTNMIEGIEEQADQDEFSQEKEDSPTRMRKGAKKRRGRPSLGSGIVRHELRDGMSYTDNMAEGKRALHELRDGTTYSDDLE